MDIDISQELEQFIIYFSCEQNVLNKAEKLHSFTIGFLRPNLQQNLYLEFMSKIISEMPCVFNSILNLIKENRSDVEFVNHAEKNLKTAGLYLQTLNLCFSCRRSLEEMLTLHVASVNTLYAAYQHCKDSELIYGDQLECISDKLGCFFNEIQDLETVVLKELDKLLVFKQNSEVLNISTVLGKLGQLLTEIDATMSFKYWKMYIKIIVKHKESLKQDFEVDSDLVFLTFEILNFFQNCQLILDQDICEEEETSLKICSLQLNVIIRILEQYSDSLNHSIPQLSTLVTRIYNLLIVCCSKKLKEASILFHIQGVISKAIKPLISLLKQNKCFRKYVLKNLDANDQNDLDLAFLMVKLACLPHFEALLEDFKFVDSLQSFFKTLQKSKPEKHVMLVSVMIPESALDPLSVPIQQKEGVTSMYNYACSQLSACWKTHPDSSLEDGAGNLLQILSESSDIVSLLLSDVWIYRLRCTSVLFLYSYCLKIAQMYNNVSSNIKVDNFLKRILKFLPPKEKCKIESEVDSFKTLTSSTYPSSHRFQIPQLLSSTDEKKTGINQQIQSLVSELKKESCKSFEYLSRRACCCLILGSFLVEVLPSDQSCMLIEFAEQLFKSQVYEIQVAALTFLKACCRKNIPENDPYGKDICKALSSLVCEGLMSSNYIVMSEAYRAFSSLAHEAPCSKIIQQTVLMAPHLKPFFTSNFNLVPICGFLSEENRLKLSLDKVSTLKRQSSPSVRDSKTLVLDLLILKEK